MAVAVPKQGTYRLVWEFLAHKQFEKFQRVMPSHEVQMSNRGGTKVFGKSYKPLRTLEMPSRRRSSGEIQDRDLHRLYSPRCVLQSVLNTTGHFCAILSQLFYDLISENFESMPQCCGSVFRRSSSISCMQSCYGSDNTSKMDF